MQRYAIVDDNGEALSTDSHTEACGVEFQSQCFGIVSIAIGEHKNLIAHVTVFAPGRHYKNIIDRHTGNRINTFSRNLIGMFHEPW
jgi:hypothetical protein